MSVAASGAPGHRAKEGRVNSVAKATTILGTFTPLVRVLSLRQIVRRTGIPRSTAHGLCLTLCDAGLLEEVPHRGYQLGTALVALGGQVMDRTGLVEAAREQLQRALRRDGMEAHLAQLVGGWVVYVDRRTGRHGAPMNNRVGMRAPAHLAGCGKAALSRLRDDDVDARVRQTCAADHLPLPDLERLREELDAARARGYVFNDDFQPGRVSVAAPIVDAHQAVVGGVSVAGPARLFDPATRQQAAADIVAVATAVSERLGERRRQRDGSGRTRTSV
jgi:DNA-binding IclR family transcriptional regulator